MLRYWFSENGSMPASLMAGLRDLDDLALRVLEGPFHAGPRGHAMATPAKLRADFTNVHPFILRPGRNADGSIGDFLEKDAHHHPLHRA